MDDSPEPIPVDARSGEALRRAGPFAAVLAAGALVVGLIGAYRIRWVCDDAFVTFRYVENLLSGSGLVYNVGERVEGYTHFLWLCLISLFRSIGLDPIGVSQMLGLLAYVGTLALFALASIRLFGKPLLPIPLTAVILALHFDFKVWATGGLETSLFTFLIATVFYLVCVVRAASGPKSWAVGFLLALSVLTRPDAMIFYLVTVVFLWFQAAGAGDPRGERRRQMIRVHVPFLLILLPYLAWKYSYYGDILPNTFYSKSGGLHYYTQGLFYIWIYLKTYPSSFVFGIGILSLIGAGAKKVGRVRQKDRRPFLLDERNGALVLATAYALSYSILFVGWVGGDFMFARFLHPVIPYLYFAGEAGLQALLGRRRLLLLIAAIVLSIVAILEKDRRDALYTDERGARRSVFGPRGIADEHWYWSHRENGRTLVDRYREIGEQLAVYFEGEPVKVLLGGQASLGYFARFPICIECAGLTDAYIAHLPLEERTRPGHEKNAPVEYLVRRGVHFVFMKPPFEEGIYRLVHFRMGDGFIRGEMFTYDRELMRRLKQRYPDAIDHVDFELYLDGWLARMPGMSIEEVEQEYQRFRDFYFRHNPDPEREARIISYLKEARSGARAP